MSKKFSMGWLIAKEIKDGKVTSFTIRDDSCGFGDTIEPFWEECSLDLSHITVEWVGNPADLAKAIERLPEEIRDREVYY